MKEEQFKGI